MISQSSSHVYATGDTILELEPVLSRLPTPLIISHLTRLLSVHGVNYPAFAVVRRLLDGGSTSMKLSGAYLNKASGPPAYADATAVAKAFPAAAQDRMVWGSDWWVRGKAGIPAVQTSGPPEWTWTERSARAGPKTAGESTTG